MPQYLWPLQGDLLKPILNVILLDVLLATLTIPQGLLAEPFASLATECPYRATLPHKLPAQASLAL